MKKGTTLLMVVVALAALVALIFAFAQRPTSPTDLGTVPSPTSTSTTIDTQDWQTYVNTAFGYQVSYPRQANIQSWPDDAVFSGELKGISIGGINDVSQFFVETWLPLEKIYGVADWYIQEHNDLVALPLERFAEAIRQMQVNDDNPNVKNKKVGNLTETSIGGQRAYSFTLTDGFSESNIQHGLGFMLPVDSTYNFIITENKVGQKLMIYYPLGDAVSEKIRDSFEFQ